MASVASALPLVINHNATFSMMELAERTATGSLPLYLIIWLYHYSPYVVALVLLLGLVIFVFYYYSTSKKKEQQARKDW